MITLRSYQTQAVNLLRESFKKNKRILLVLATGSGKTIVFSSMAKLAYEKGTQTLIATDRIELLSQTLKAISKHNITPQIIDANTKNFNPKSPITLCMIETITRRLKTKWKNGNFQPKLIIIDEAHKSNFFKLIDMFPQAHCIGATATPINKKLHLYYADIVNNIGIQELIKSGYLCEAKSYQMQDNFDEVEIKRGEYVESQLFEHYNNPRLYNGVIEKYLEKTPSQKALVFNVSIQHAINTNKSFNDAGIHSEVITSNTPMDERKKILHDFEEGKFNILNSCSVLTNGIDIPSIEVIIMNRATVSLTLFLQCIGRGSRPTETKKQFTILDFGMNFIRHGLWEEERKWELKPPKKKKKGDAPVRICPKCDALLHARIMVCPFCGYIFAEKPREYKDGVMVEVKPNGIPIELKGKKLSMLTVNELVQLAKSGMYGKPFIWRVVRSKGERAIDDFGWTMGYANGWSFYQKKDIKDCNYRDVVL